MPDRSPKNVLHTTLHALGSTVTQRIVQAAVLTILAFVVATGKGMVRNVYAQETISIMKPSMDALNSRVDTVQKRVQEISDSQSNTNRKVDRVDEKVDALIDVMRRAFPEFKKAAQEKAAEDRDSKEVRDALTGDKQ